MSIALILPKRGPDDLARAIRDIDPSMPVQCWPEVGDPDSVRMAVAWHQPEGSLEAFPNLEAVSSFGAGVDGLLGDRRMPRNVALGRIVYPGLVSQMSQYVVAAILAHQRSLWQYAREQQRGKWQPRFAPSIATVGILGLGELGADAASKLVALGYEVAGWSRTPKELPGVASFTGEGGLHELAARSDAVVCLLPLTRATTGILDASLFRSARRGCFLVNVARGGHLVEADLLEALERGQLSGACLDVFSEEPLPADHPFWTHPAIHVTPHVASMTDPRAAAEHVVEDYRRLLSGRPLQHPVDREREY